MALALATAHEARAQQVAGAAGAQPATAPKAAYDAAIQGMSCRQQGSGRLDCEYKIGKSLWFLIAGVGQQDATINFYKVNADEDFVASVAQLHGCVVVRPAAARSDTVASAAFVSPVDGKVYRNWNTCASKRKEAEERRTNRPE